MFPPTYYPQTFFAPTYYPPAAGDIPFVVIRQSTGSRRRYPLPQRAIDIEGTLVIPRITLSGLAIVTDPDEWLLGLPDEALAEV